MSTMIDCPQLLEINTGDYATSVTFTANGEHLVGRDGDNTVGVWQVKDGKRVGTMQVEDVYSVAVSKDGEFIAAGSRWGKVFVWNATTYEQVFMGELGSIDPTCDVDFSPDSTRLVTGNYYSTATIWDIATHQKVRTLDVNKNSPVEAVKYSPQGDRIATASCESIRVWDSNDGRLLVDIKVPGLGILWFNKYLFVAAKDRTLKQINAATGSTVSEWRVSDTIFVPHIALPQHGKFIAYSTSNTLTFWDTSAHTQLGPIQHIDDIRSMACSPDGQLLAIAAGEKIIVKDMSSTISRFILDPELDIDGAALIAWERGQLINAEALLTAAIPTSEDTIHHVLASRALVQARLGRWDAALVDARKSIKIQRSLIGYVAKCVAFICEGEKDKGIRVCDIAFRHFQEHATLLLLIKAVVLFMAEEHVDAVSRMDDLIADSADTFVDPTLYVVQAHMHLLHGNKHMESSDYARAIQSFEDARVRLRDYTCQPPLIVSLISGWRFDDLAITIQQRLCEALFAAGRTKQAAVSVLRVVDQEVHMTESIKTWVSDFKSTCCGRLEDLGNSALNAKQYDKAASWYTAALSLDPAGSRDLLMKRSNAWMGKGAREDALNDAKEWTRLMLTSDSWKDALTAAFILDRFTIYRAVCEHLKTTGHVMDAIACFHQMSSDLAQEIDEEQANWTHDFKVRSRGKLEDLGDNAVNAKQYDEAILQYTMALSLVPTRPQDLLVKRSKAFAAAGIWKDALNDANEVIKLDPSSPLGYERKHHAIRGARRDSDATAAFEMMLLKMSESPDPEIREQSRHYVRPEATQETIRSVIKDVVHGSPPVLINTNSGRLCNKSEQISTFESTPIFTDLVCSMTTQIDHALIERVVGKFFRYAMLSHTWEGDEPLYKKVVKIVVYDLEASPTHSKLQMFCKIVRDEGFRWAWSDTCCIDRGNHFVLQEALVRMFKWYEGSAMTIIFLYDVDQLAELGALMMSRWNSRGWTLQEYHASKAVRIYTRDWTPYLGLTIYNHKESPQIISEMEKATGISARSLIALRPGLNDIREKLRLASTRQTTRVEDAAYSLLGIFSMTLPVTYGEEDKALGRLLSQILTSSGDASVLAWTGRPGSFNSCLPTDIAVFSQPLSSHIPPAIADAEMETVTARLRASPLDVNLATRLYDRMHELPTPTFAGQRMRLPCLVFKIKLVSRCQDGSQYVFGAQAGAIRAVEIKTKKKLTRLGSLYLVHPWTGFLLDRHAAGSVVGMAAGEDESPWLGNFPFTESSSTLNAHGLHSASLSSFLTAPTTDAEMCVYEFLTRLRQPFGALLLTSNPRNTAEYRRVAAESMITVQVEEITSAVLNELIQSVRVLDVL